MAIKLYYNKTTYQLITIDDNNESLIKGDNNSKAFEFYFGTGTALVDFVLDATIPLTYEGRVTFKRADDETTNDVYLTPITGGFYRYVIGDWVTEVEGDLKITARLKLGAVYTAFGIATIPVEDGVAPDDGSTISQLQYDAIMGTVNDVIIGTTPIAYDNAVSGLAAVDVQGAIDEVDADVDELAVRVTTAETDIDILEGRATVLETFKDTTVPATYETIANADTVRDRVTAVESGKEDVVDANAHRVRTTNLETAAMFKHVSWDSTTGVITFTRYDDTTETVDLPTEMIFDTVVYDDVNMQLVFTLKNGASFTVPIDDILTGIATEDWVVLNYYNKTQGDTKYVAKDISSYTNLTAEENKTSARIYVDDNGTPKKMTLGEIYEGANSASGAFIPNGVYEDLTSGYAIKSQSGIDIDEEFTEIDGRLDNIVDGTTVIEESYNTNTILTHDLTYVSNGDFKANLTTIDEDKIVFVKFPTTTSTSTLRVSVDDGVTYYNVVKNGKTMQAFIASGQLVRLEFDGTKFIGDMQGDVDVEATYGEPIESTYGEFAPLDGGVPLVSEIQGMLLDAPQLVTNGDFSDGTTGWTALASASLSITNEEFLISSTSGLGTLPGFTTTVPSQNISGKYYVNLRVKPLTSNYSNFGYYNGVGYTYAINNNTTLTLNNWNNLSFFHQVGVDNWTDLAIVIEKSDSSLMQFNFDNIRLFNISTLIANKQYSPLYSTTFDLMSDAQIKTQMDLWVKDGTLPSEIQAVSNTTLQSVGKNLFDKSDYTINYRLDETTGVQTPLNDYLISNYINAKSLSNYYLSGATAGPFLTVVEYDSNMNIIKTTNTYGGTIGFTTLSNTIYVRVSTRIDMLDTLQLELGSTATTYEPYKSATQTFTHGPLRSCITDGTIRDRIYYNDGQYLLDQYVDTDGTALTTPILNTPIDVDGLLLQDDVTTIYQLQDLATTYKVRFALNTEQTVKTLVERDRLQQGEIDSNEANIVTLTARKTTTNDIIIMSETAWSTYTQVTGEVYGVYNESTFVITWYYGQTE